MVGVLVRRDLEKLMLENRKGSALNTMDTGRKGPAGLATIAMSVSTSRLRTK